jgi:hypothetical protein
MAFNALTNPEEHPWADAEYGMMRAVEAAGYDRFDLVMIDEVESREANEDDGIDLGDYDLFRRILCNHKLK